MQILDAYFNFLLNCNLFIFVVVMTIESFVVVQQKRARVVRSLRALDTTQQNSCFSRICDSLKKPPEEYMLFQPGSDRQNNRQDLYHSLHEAFICSTRRESATLVRHERQGSPAKGEKNPRLQRSPR